MGKIYIPISVARLVVKSLEAAEAPEPNSELAIVHNQFKDALGKTWQRTFRCDSVERWELMIKVVADVRAELAVKSTRTALIPLDRFIGELEVELNRQRTLDKVRAADQLEADQKAKQDYRRRSTQQREQTMRGAIEAGRRLAIRQIGEDYGLDHADPQIRAALVAAYHAGAQKFAQAVDQMRYAEPQPFDPEELDRLRMQDKQLFADARAARDAKSGLS